jgi:hypothetical protein
MSLDMSGHIDSTFESVTATRAAKAGGAYVDGKWVDGSSTATNHTVNLQPLNDRERKTLQEAGERIVDARKCYVNDGDTYSVSEADTWSFTGVDGVFKTVSVDNRPWRNYCKIVVSRIDD